MPILFILIGLSLVLLAVQKYYEKHWAKKLNVTVNFQANPAIEGGEATLTEIIRNEKNLPIPLLHVKFQTDRNCEFRGNENANISDKTYKNDIFSLMGYQQVTRNLIFKCKKRGIYKINHIDLVSSVLFFQNISCVETEADTSLTVYPRTVELDGLDEIVRQIVWSSQNKSSLMPDPFSMIGVREYQPYDPMKYINWKASAKTGELCVNIQEKLSGQPVIVLMNLQKPLGRLADDLLEEIIRIGVSWTERLMQEGLFVSLVSNIDGKRIDDDRTEGWDDINIRMAEIDLKKQDRTFAEWIEEDVIPHVREDICYGVISCDESDASYTAVEELAQRTGELWLIRPGHSDSERYEHSNRVHVLERWLNIYEK